MNRDIVETYNAVFAVVQQVRFEVYAVAPPGEFYEASVPCWTRISCGVEPELPYVVCRNGKQRVNGRQYHSLIYHVFA